MPIFCANSFSTAGLLSSGSHFFPMLQRADQSAFNLSAFNTASAFRATVFCVTNTSTVMSGNEQSDDATLLRPRREAGVLSCGSRCQTCQTPDLKLTSYVCAVVWQGHSAFDCSAPCAGSIFQHQHHKCLLEHAIAHSMTVSE